MKIGDKILCINNCDTLYLKNNYYYICEIARDKWKVDQAELYEVIYIKSEENSIFGFGNYYTSNDTIVTFNDFFINIKERRKQKLEKLNESRILESTQK